MYRRVQRGSREGQQRSRRQHAACSCGRSESSIPGYYSVGRYVNVMLLNS